MIETNQFLNIDCMEYMKSLPKNSVDLILTDIPYGEVTRESNGLYNLDRGNADIVKFNVLSFVEECYRLAKSTVIIFCGKGQFSEIYTFFDDEQKKKKGTVRQITWIKTNPVPSNGKFIYLSGVEIAVWFKKKGGTFNANCKNPVFHYPILGGKRRIHPTEKHHDLIKELILDNSNEGDIVFDPCAGGGSTLLMAKETGRKYLGCELDSEFYNKAKERLDKWQSIQATSEPKEVKKVIKSIHRLEGGT